MDLASVTHWESPCHGIDHAMIVGEPGMGAVVESVKLGFVINLLQLYSGGIADPKSPGHRVWGDSVFLLLFAYYFYVLVSSSRTP